MPALDPRCVHVWVASLDCEAARSREALACGDERMRAANSLRPDSARLRVRARGVLQELLGLYGTGDSLAPRPGDSLDRDAACAGTRGLHVSVSHSRSLAVFAFARTTRVGIDVEALAGREIDAPRLAARAFGAGESERLLALSGRARTREFLRLWTLHEARAKCTGSGMWAAAPRPAATLPGPGPWLTELSLESACRDASDGSEISAALAVARRPDEVCVLDWNANVR